MQDDFPILHCVLHDQHTFTSLQLLLVWGWEPHTCVGCGIFPCAANISALPIMWTCVISEHNEMYNHDKWAKVLATGLKSESPFPWPEEQSTHTKCIFGKHWMHITLCVAYVPGVICVLYMKGNEWTTPTWAAWIWTIGRRCLLSRHESKRLWCLADQ